MEKTRVRVAATVSWYMDMPDDGNVAKTAKEYLTGLLPVGFDVFIAKSKPRGNKSNLQRLGEFGLEDVFSKLTTSENRIEFKVGENSYFVRMNSHRYFVFKYNPTCVSCGLHGSKFILEQHINDKSPHFNLYGEEDGHLVLFTKDHIHAKSHGGEDRHSNYQTMCAVCNNLKADLHIPLAGIRELRSIYNENRNTPRKTLNRLLQEARQRLVVPFPEQPKKQGIQLLVDLGVVNGENGLIGVSIYEAVDPIACMKKGTKLYPSVIRDKKLVLPFNSTQLELHQGFTDLDDCHTEA